MEGLNVSKKDKKKDKPKTTADRVRKKAVKIATNPVVAEVVASTLVAAAAAMRNPKKARAIAEAAVDEVESASKQMADKGSALWKLAMDVARKSIDSIVTDEPAAKPQKKTAKKAAKKPAKKKSKK
jgi:DeoR/GlpR family transcriptional regulator of sugar metabolism